MFNRYRFYTGAIILDENKKLELRTISVDDEDYLKKMPEHWYKYYYNFTVNKNPIKFKPGDDGEENDLIYIENFDLPPYFKLFNTSSSMQDFHSIRTYHMKPKIIKSIISSTSYNNQELILFQKFRDSVQMGYDVKFSLDSDTLSFNRVKGPLVSFGSDIMAVYDIKDKLIRFKRFNDVSLILDLYRYFAPLSEKEIKKFLSDDDGLFEYNEKDMDEIIYHASPLLAKRFALVKDRLDNNTITAEHAKSISLKYKDNIEYSVDVNLSDNGKKIVFPSKKSEAHNLLRFLNGDFYTDDLTGDPFLARSKRKLK